VTSLESYASAALALSVLHTEILHENTPHKYAAIAKINLYMKKVIVTAQNAGLILDSTTKTHKRLWL
jgi:hypothetical protein